MPAKVIKLDKSLIDTMKGSARARVVVAELIHMADNMNMEVVAEGVETLAQVDRLKSLECDYIQGYYYSKPLPNEQFIEYVKKNSKN